MVPYKDSKKIKSIGPGGHMITIHFNKEENLYEQIYQFFIKEIRQARIKSGEKLPSRRALAQHLGVSLNTIKLAYDQLMDEGYIISKERSGFYVDKLSPEDLPRIPKARTPFVAPKTIKAKYNFTYSSIDKSRMPLSILKKCAQEAMEESIGLGRGPKGGIWSLREEIAKYLENRRGVVASVENIIITSGYSEHLLLLMSLIDNPSFAMEDPGYKKTQKIFEGAGRKITQIPIDKYGFSVRDLEKTQSNIAIVTPNHQFPTGIIMGLRRRQRLLAWAAERDDRYIVEDDYDSDFKYAGNPVPALKSLDKKDQVILSGSFSQSIGPFLGISYLVLPYTLRKKFEELDLPLSGASVLQQLTLEKFLASGDFERHVNRMNAHYRKKRQILLKRLKKEKGIEILGADVGLHFILRMDPEKWDLKDSRRRIKQNRMAMARVDQYTNRKWLEEDYIIGFGDIPMENLEEGIEVFLDEMRKK